MQRSRSPSPFSVVSSHDEPAGAESLESGPASEVHAIDAGACRLLVDSGLRGAAAEAAWLTVTGLDGTLYFEGSMSLDGCVEVCFEASSAPPVEIVCVRLETPTTHRQAEVRLGEGWTTHSFV
jgi:hypothetical protein